MKKVYFPQPKFKIGQTVYRKFDPEMEWEWRNQYCNIYEIQNKIDDILDCDSKIFSADKVIRINCNGQRIEYFLESRGGFKEEGLCDSKQECLDLLNAEKEKYLEHSLKDYEKNMKELADTQKKYYEKFEDIKKDNLVRKIAGV